MSCFVGGSGRENLMFFFPAKKAQDVRRAMVGFLLFVKAFLAVTSHFSTYRHFFVSLCPAILCARKLLLLFCLFLDRNLNRIDSIIPTLIIFILRWWWRWRWQPRDFCWWSNRVRRLLHWMGGGGGGGRECCAGGPKGIALASFDQGLVSFWV